MLVLRLRKSDNAIDATAPKRVDAKPADTDTIKWIEVTPAEAAALRQRIQDRHDQIRTQAPIIAGGSPGAYTFTIGDDPRHRIKFDQQAGTPDNKYVVQKGVNLPLTVTLIDDDGNTRTGVNVTHDMVCGPETFGNQQRVIRLDFVNGVASRTITMPDSGVFYVRAGPNWRMDAQRKITVWE